MSAAAILIITHNSGAEIGACLDAAFRCNAEVLVIDNASADDTRIQVEKRAVRHIWNSENAGFAAAVNQGVRALNHAFILLLNPDVVLLGSIEPLVETCKLPEVGAAGGKLVDESGVQTGFCVRQIATPAALIFEALLLNRLWKTNPVNWYYRCLGFDYEKQQPVGQPAGALLMFRREAWERVGGFDEGFYPVWFEDVDFCRRLKAAGYQIYYEPGAVAKHTGGHSISSLPVENRQYYWYRSLIRYSAKHFTSVSFRLVCLAVFVGCGLRMITGIAFRRTLKSPGRPGLGNVSLGRQGSVAIYGRVARLAGRALASSRRAVLGSLSVP